MTRGRVGHRVPGAARRAREDAAPAHPRGHPRPPRFRGRSRGARGAGDRDVRPRLHQPLPVRAGRRLGAEPEEEIIEMIDVGGPAMLRAAAKNHSVTPVCRPEDYDDVLGGAPPAAARRAHETRRRLATIAFARTAAYDAAIAAWFAENEQFPRPTCPSSTRCGSRLRREPAPGRRLLRRARRTHAPPGPRRAGARPRALVQQPQRPERRPPAACASSRCRPA